MATDALWSNVKFFSHCDDPAFKDSCEGVMTITGNGALSAAQSKSGGKSFLQTSASTSFVTVMPTADIGLTTSQNWCIEAWIYPTDTSGVFTLFTTKQTVGSGQVLLSNINGSLSAGVTNSSSSNITVTGGSAPVNTWTHVALVRNGANLVLYTNGTGGTPVAVGTTNLEAAYETLFYWGGDIARWNSASLDSRSFRGHMDGLRITVGNSRYTSNFTPAATYDGPPSISGTVRDSANALVARTVRAYRRSDGLLTGEAVSNVTTGVFTLTARDTSPHTVLAFDNGTPDENALIFDSFIPS